MKIVVATCWAYRDAWAPFFQLLDRFWPHCPYSRHLLTDYCRDRAMVPSGVSTHEYSGNWCENLYRFARDHSDAPMILVQEDFFLNAPVDDRAVRHAELEILRHAAGCCRLFPCPPADYCENDPWFGTIRRSTRYRISCQAAVWDPKFIVDILSRGTDETIRPNDFELDGTSIAESLPPEVLAIRGDISPWPFSYICSGISNGLWNPEALRFCSSIGVSIDRSLRGVGAGT